MFPDLNGRHYKTNDNISVSIEGGVVKEIRKISNEKELPFIGPGLVDLQINGAFGVDFNADDLTAEKVKFVTKKLWEHGVTTFFPTIITNSEDRITKYIKVIMEACHQEKLVDATISGIHIEGPFISPKDGPRGVHNKKFVKKPNWKMLKKWYDLSNGKIRIVTLSPEWEGSIPFIRKCVKNNIVVAIGHTAATTEQIAEAVKAGAKLSTHLGNGAHLTLPRHPNYVWDQLAEDNLWTSIIADGFHLPDAVMKVVTKVKKEKAIIVSDAVNLCGLEPGEYTTQIGGKVKLTKNGKLHMVHDSNVLAGSAKLLLNGIENLVNKQILNAGDAWDAASKFPAELAHLPVSKGIIEGQKADLVFFNWTNGKLNIELTIKEGKLVFRRRGLELKLNHS